MLPGVVRPARVVTSAGDPEPPQPLGKLQIPGQQAEPAVTLWAATRWGRSLLQNGGGVLQVVSAEAGERTGHTWGVFLVKSED